MDTEELLDALDSDFDYTREVYRELVEAGREGIKEMQRIAGEVEHPRAYEVLGKLIKDIGDVADKMIDNPGKVKKIKDVNVNPNNPKLPKGGGVVLVGTVAELQKAMQRNREEEAERRIEQPSNVEHITYDQPQE